MGLDLYNFPPSGPCRAVQMTAKAIGVELNLKSTNLLAGEHLTPEYLKVKNRITSANQVLATSCFSSPFRSIHSTPSQHWSMTVSPCGSLALSKLIWSRNTRRLIRCTQRIHRNVPSSTNACILMHICMPAPSSTIISRKFLPSSQRTQTT